MPSRIKRFIVIIEHHEWFLDYKIHFFHQNIYLNNILSTKDFDKTCCLIRLKFCPPITLITLSLFSGCRFRGERGDEKFVRLKEDAIKGSEAFRVSAFPRSGFKIQALDGVRIRK